MAGARMNRSAPVVAVNVAYRKCAKSAGRIVAGKIRQRTDLDDIEPSAGNICVHPRFLISGITRCLEYIKGNLAETTIE